MKHPILFLASTIIGIQTLLLDSPALFTDIASVITPSAQAEESVKATYTCPMHPQIRSDHPGKCPICGMDLVPLDGGGYGHEHGTNENSEMPVISVTAENIQKMGVHTEKAELSQFGQNIRASGIITENERTRWDMFSQVEGRVEDFKYAQGDIVKKGDIFYYLTSPELIALQNDYIVSYKSGLSEVATAAKNRMKILGVDERVLKEITKSGKAYQKVPLYIPADGVLNNLLIRNGHYLKVNDEIGHIQNLSTIWVEASVPEKDITSVKEGDSAKIIAENNIYEAKVEYIYPAIDNETRTGKIRLVVDNKDGLLKPAGYVSVEFASTPTTTKVLTVPSEAILMDSVGSHVIVSIGEGKFQSRNVKAGSNSNGRTEIISGISDGEEVVVNGQFLIDSESNLRESLKKSQEPESNQQSTPMNNMEMKHE